MASIVLGAAGAAAGNALLPGIGGIFAGSLGRSLGGLVDSKLGLGGQVKGPQLNNLAVQDSRYGAGIPIIYGQARVAGNVIWSTALIAASHTQTASGGKGGIVSSSVSETTYTYSVHCAIGIAQGPVGGITTIWADSTIIYQDGVWVAGLVGAASLYLGNLGQAPDAFMQSIIGAGAVPAYQGLAYVVFETLQLASFGNRLPNLTFEIAPVTTTSDPALLGSVDAGVSQRFQTMQGGGCLPITLSTTAGGVGTALVGGYVASGSSCALAAVTLDVTGDTPLQLSRAQSANFTSSNPGDCAWALSPDGRFVAMQAFDSSSLQYHLALYDSELRSFGPVLAVNLYAASAVNAIGWLDAQRFVMIDAAGSTRGVHVFQRAGSGIVDLGFYPVWGAGSLTSRLPVSYAQFTPYAGGLIHYLGDDPSGAILTAFYACSLTWRNNALVAGAPYTVFSGISTATGSQPHSNLMPTGGDEWTLCLATPAGFHLISFVPTPTGAAITRPWQDFTSGFGPSLTRFPIAYGDRILLLQHAESDSQYRLSEVLLNAGSFTPALDGAVVAGMANSSYMSAIRLDSARLLVTNVAGFAQDLNQVAILQRCVTGEGLDTIVADLLTRSGYQSGDYNLATLSGTAVQGYVISEPMTARAALEPLQVYEPFDLVESDAQLKAIPRHGDADLVIPASEWRAVLEKDEPPPALGITRAQELDLPHEVDVDHIDPARNFEVNTQRARRLAGLAVATQKLGLPLVCSAGIAKQIAETRLYSLWAERELVRIYLSRAWLMLDPGDVVDLGTGDLLRVTKVMQSGGLMEVAGFYLNAAAYDSLAATDSTQALVPPMAVTPDSLLYLLDLPLLQATDNQPGVYAAATGLAGWNGASLWRSADGVNYATIASLPQLATAGSAVSVLPNASPCYLDQASAVQIQLVSGSLSSCSMTDLLNGANPCVIGSEILQFQTATLTGPGLYSLSNLLRGRRGTEYAIATHALGENFVLLTTGTIDFVPALLTDRGAADDFRALTKGQTLSDAQDTAFSYGLNTICPFSPCNLAGYRATGPGGDVTISWTRRARLQAEWVSYIDVPLDEPVELYDVEVMNGAAVLRTFSSVTVPTITYTAAQQSADWGASIPARVTVNVYQLSSRYGRGRAGMALV